MLGFGPLSFRALTTLPSGSGPAPPVVVVVDTHDGVTKRSRRQRKLQAAEVRRRDELAAEATALRLSLEAAMGLAAEVIEDAPAPVVAKIEAVQRRVAPIVARREPISAAPALAAIAELKAAIDEAMAAKALADDDEDVELLLRAL
jgi:hypothetical protein